MELRITAAIGLLAMALGATAGPGLAQEAAEQEEHTAGTQADPIERAQEVMERMHEAAERGHELHSEMGEDAREMYEEMGPEMLLQNERLRDMGRDMANAAANLAWTAEGVWETLLDAEGLDRPEMSEPAEQVLAALEQTADPVEEGLEAVEQAREQMHVLLEQEEQEEEEQESGGR